MFELTIHCSGDCRMLVNDTNHGDTVKVAVKTFDNTKALWLAQEFVERLRFEETFDGAVTTTLEACVEMVKQHPDDEFEDFPWFFFGNADHHIKLGKVKEKFYHYEMKG